MPNCVRGVVRATIGAATVLIAAGCSDTGGPDSTGEAVAGTGLLMVTMQQSSGAGVSAVQSVQGEESGKIDLDNVASLTVRVTSIQFLPAGADDTEENGGASEEDGGGWIVLEFAEPVAFDLLALPTEGESPLVVAAGAVAAGDYRKVRYLVGDAIIVFNEAFTVGNATFEGEHAVTIPSGAKPGLKTDVAFTVVADDGGTPQEVTLLFEPGATFQNSTATGSGKVIVAPVIR